MKNKQIEKLINCGNDFEKAGDFEKAMEAYTRAMDILVDIAKSQAQIADPLMVSAVMGSGIVSQDFLKKFNDCLKRNQTAAIVSNSMAMIFAKMGDMASARDFFEQAIDLTPNGVAYNDPYIGLEMLKKMG